MDTPPSHGPVPDLICFSHLRWDFVYQRPQHLMSRFARTRRVLFIEEPMFEATVEPHLRTSVCERGVEVIIPILPEGVDARATILLQRVLLAELIERACTPHPTFWFQTPMAFSFAPTDLAGVVVYDCMDELSTFNNAPASLLFNEKQLLGRADLVFTGGRSLYEAKRSKHSNVHCFPSGIDAAHFRKARAHRHGTECLSEFAEMPDGPRIGFAGVIDERLDIDLLAAVADARPDCQFTMIGPVVKIDPDLLPRRDNIHYLGFRDYQALPALMAEWDVAMMPFARNAATAYISPTKTPEYLAAGLPVVATGIRDVVRQYGDTGLVAIANDPAEFAAAIDRARLVRDDPARLREVDAALEHLSWDSTWRRMAALERSAAQSLWQVETDTVARALTVAMEGDIEVWGGVECTLNRVGEEFHSQLESNGHLRRIESDLDAFASLGISAIRYPVLWELVETEPGLLDFTDSDRALAHLEAGPMRPILGLVHHGSGPRWDLTDRPDFPRLLAEFARAVARRYPWVADYTPVNEPLTTARFAALYGIWYPHQRNDMAFVRALLNEARGTVLAMRRDSRGQSVSPAHSDRRPR